MFLPYANTNIIAYFGNIYLCDVKI